MIRRAVIRCAVAASAQSPIKHRRRPGAHLARTGALRGPGKCLAETYVFDGSPPGLPPVCVAASSRDQQCRRSRGRLTAHARVDTLVVDTRRDTSGAPEGDEAESGQALIHLCTTAADGGTPLLAALQQRRVPVAPLLRSSFSVGRLCRPLSPPAGETACTRSLQQARSSQYCKGFGSRMHHPY